MTDLLVPNPPPAGRKLQIGVVVTVLALGLGLLWWIDPAKTPVPLCGFHAMTGLHCPGCGTLRATHELLRGRPLAALRDNALWTLSLPLLLYLGMSQLGNLAGYRPFPGDLTHKPWFWISVAVAATVFGVLRNLPWTPLTWLAPPG